MYPLKQADDFTPLHRTLQRVNVVTAVTITVMNELCLSIPVIGCTEKGSSDLHSTTHCQRTELSLNKLDILWSIGVRKCEGGGILLATSQQRSIKFNGTKFIIHVVPWWNKCEKNIVILLH